MSILDTEVDGSNPSISMFFPWARNFIRIASVDSAVKWVSGGDNLVKGGQCYELVGGIALKNHAFSFFFIFKLDLHVCTEEIKNLSNCTLVSLPLNAVQLHGAHTPQIISTSLDANRRAAWLVEDNNCRQCSLSTMEHHLNYWNTLAHCKGIAQIFILWKSYVGLISVKI